jgi:hypothetical protein
MGAVGIWNGWWGAGESSKQNKTGATIAWKTNPTNTRKLGQRGKRMGQEKEKKIGNVEWSVELGA